MKLSDNAQKIYAILFALGDPTKADDIALALEVPVFEIVDAIDELKDYFEKNEVPLDVKNLDGEYQLTTREEYTGIIKKVMAEKRNTPLSQAALEVLAAVAYNQPVTRSYIEQVRGVDSSGTVVSLVEKGLLEEAGRLDLPGRPISYRTTANFLRTFGISSLEELPEVSSSSPLDNDQLTLEDVKE